MYSGRYGRLFVKIINENVSYFCITNAYDVKNMNTIPPNVFLLQILNVNEVSTKIRWQLARTDDLRFI